MIQKLSGLKNTDLMILLVRLALAAVFIAHGFSKLSNMDGTVAFFGNLGFAPILAYLVMIIEIVGGIFLLLGFFVQHVGILLGIVMLVVIFKVKLSKGFLGGYEFEFTLLLSLLALLFSGPGKYSLQSLLKKGSQTPNL